VRGRYSDDVILVQVGVYYELDCYLARLLGMGRSASVVRQGEQHWTDIREWGLVWRIVPAST
jgi:hypothetical protein